MSERAEELRERRRRRARDARRRSGVPHARVRRHPPALAAQAAPAAAATALRADRPGVRHERRATRATATSPGSTRASRSASASSSAAACSAPTAARCAARWSRSGRPTPPAATATASTSTPRRSTRTSRAAGACLTDDDGRYRFITIKPGAYPWRNHDNAWRPAHIHLSVFGRAFTERLVTQMYFPGDPLFAYDPIYQSVRDPAARERMISHVRPRLDEARVGARLQLRRRARRRRARRRWRTREPAAARRRRPSGRSSSSASRRSRSWSPRTPRRDPHRRARCSTAPACRCRTASSRSGGPTPTGATRAALGWGRCQTGARRRLRASRPSSRARCRDADGRSEAPHVSVLCFARGLLKPVLTRIYFPDEAAANAADPVLLRARRRRRARDAVATAERRRGLPLRHPPAGRRADGLLHDAGVRAVTRLAARRPGGRAGRRALELARHDARDVGAADGGAERALRRAALRPPRPRRGPRRAHGALGRGARARRARHRSTSAASSASRSAASRSAAPSACGSRCNAPERIDRLVLACTSARFGVPASWLERAATVRAEGMDVVADRILGSGSRRRRAPSAPSSCASTAR